MNPLAVLLRRAAGDPRPDGELLAAFLADRDEAAFAEVVRRHGGLVWGVCRRTLPDLADAEDAFQATFLVLVRRAGRLTHAATIGPWLHRVAAWTARNLRRKNARRLSRRRELSDALSVPSASEPTCDLDALLLALPDRYRAALVLCHLGGLTHREAAARLGCAEGTVSSLVSRGLAKLRAKLAADPTPLLVAALAGAAPASLSAAAVKSAVALQLASLSVAASPAVVSLVKGVLPMFWVKKATVAGMMAVMLAATGVGVGVRQVSRAVAAEPSQTDNEPQSDRSAKLKAAESRLRELEAQQKRLREQEAKLDEQVAQQRKQLQVDEQVAQQRKQLQIEIERAKREQEAQKKVAGSYLAINVHQNPPSMSQTPHAVIINEFRSDKVVWTTTFPGLFQNNKPPDWTLVRAYLTRIKNDPNGPRRIIIGTAGNAPRAYVQALVQVCRDAGFTDITDITAQVTAVMNQMGVPGVEITSGGKTQIRGNGINSFVLPVRGDAIIRLTQKATIASAYCNDEGNAIQVLPQPNKDKSAVLIVAEKPGKATLVLIDEQKRPYVLYLTVTPPPLPPLPGTP